MCSDMTNHDNWLGYLIYVFVKETLTYSKECCPGCIDRKNSPLLHTHHHNGLLEKLHMFYPAVKDLMLSKMAVLVADYVSKYPDPEIYDEVGQKVLRAFGRDFLAQSDPKSIYYSHYLTPEIDEKLTETSELRVKPTNVKRLASKMNKKQPLRKKSKKDNITTSTAI